MARVCKFYFDDENTAVLEQTLDGDQGDGGDTGVVKVGQVWWVGNQKEDIAELAGVSLDAVCFYHGE